MTREALVSRDLYRNSPLRNYRSSWECTPGRFTMIAMMTDDDRVPIRRVGRPFVTAITGRVGGTGPGAPRCLGELA